MNITNFAFHNNLVRVIHDNGIVWFNALDICAALGYANPHKALSDHVDADDLTKREVIDTLGRRQATNHINESGMYALIFGSKKGEALDFKRWVTSEVLPAIRKTGQYIDPAVAAAQPAAAGITIDLLLALFNNLLAHFKASEREKFRLVRHLIKVREAGHDGTEPTPWTEIEMGALIELRKSGSSISEIAHELGRSRGAVSAQINKLKRQGHLPTEGELVTH